MRSLRFALALPACAALALGPAAGARDRDEGTVVQDLAYGEVLFHFFKEDYFAALTRLLAAQSRGELPTHALEADLMLGGLYLSYGQHRLAGEIFERTLAESVAPELHDRAWFFLAKIWQQRGYLAEAEAALARITGALPDELEPDRRMLHAQVLMEQERFAEALTVLDEWRRPRADFVGYAKFNIGVALVRMGRVAEGAAVLDEVGLLDADNPALAPLRDKANVALGYAWLKAGQPAAARTPLQRVRLTGPYSNKALLGVGWAAAEHADYRAALAPWLELRGRNLLDAAVQESLLAVPYAYAQLGAQRQAAEHYEAAIAAFDGEIARLDTAIDAITSGVLVTDLLGRRSDDERDASGWYWRLERVPDSVEARYLHELLATHAFQEGLKNYRDLLDLDRNLDRWSESLGAFDDILDTRQRAYEQRLPRIDSSLDAVDLAELARRRVELESRLAAIERTQDVVALGTPAEQEQYARLVAMEPLLELAGDDPAASEARDKQRFLKGLLVWNLERDYKARLWAAKKGLSDLDRELREAQRRHHEVSSARDDWPETFAAQSARIATLQPRVASLKARAAELLEAQRTHLVDIAVGELRAQRERLDTYRIQARFALASVYDRASVAGVAE